MCADKRVVAGEIIGVGRHAVRCPIHWRSTNAQVHRNQFSDNEILVGRRRKPQCDVDAVLRQIYDPVGEDQVDAGFRIVAQEGIDQRWKLRLVHAMRRGNAQASTGSRRPVLEFCLSFLHQLQHWFASFEQQYAGVRQAYGVAGTVQQADTEATFQRRDVLADGSSGQLQLARGAGEAAGARDFAEGSQEIQAIHGLLPAVRTATRTLQVRPSFFLRLASTSPAGMKRRSFVRTDACPGGVQRMRQGPSAASTMVFATLCGPGALPTLSAT